MFRAGVGGAFADDYKRRFGGFEELSNFEEDSLFCAWFRPIRYD